MILHHLGLPDQAVIPVDWWELDRTIEPDHLTSVYLPPGTPPLGGADDGPSVEVANLVALMDTLRERCPWDRAQTHASLMPHLVEECYEVLDALAELDALAAPDSREPLDNGDGPDARRRAYEHLQEELGDLLFQIVFHARLAGEADEFTLADVARTVHDKLVHRHPHVFGDVVVDGAEQVVQNWEDIKKSEKDRRSVTEGIPAALPALMLTTKLARKARAVGLDPTSTIAGSVIADLTALEQRAAQQRAARRRPPFERCCRGGPRGRCGALRGRRTWRNESGSMRNRPCGTERWYSARRSSRPKASPIRRIATASLGSPVSRQGRRQGEMS